MTVRVKICGITRHEDARHAIACGADALGLVFYDQSPRCVTLAQAREIVAGLPPFVSLVGLFVNAEADFIRQTVESCGLDVVQLHGDEPPEACHHGRLKVIKALRVQNRQSLENLAAYQVSAILLDAWSPDRYGGSGECFDWQLAAEVAHARSLILAGGLTPENVGEAVQTVRPYAVDVSSGVESSPGIKDPEKVAAFIARARQEC
jgi:phosphoribosylanthranilate isomerase